ncbi:MULTISPECIES: hypothetical protein [unclassified Streptomyces]|uniref:hypothetical protein n=1 Tax=unclassified Streptomyces TaxID=2593676 RepID=UPI000DB9D888|nr:MULTISPECIES: hypothetical protein [unclassified Streptomyces]MYT69299.1 hypothetical protein [Streptomyces sp. SID8367]RAJ79685.1 hypothetical protein K377_04878 [Streptomyces sp. PsTaAH-137]
MTYALSDPAVTARVVDHAGAVPHAATPTRSAALLGGLDDTAAERAAVRTTELAGNLLRHAVAGAMYVRCRPLGDGIDVAAFLLGMPPRLLAAALRHGHRSARDDATAPVSGAARRSP